MSLNFGQSLFPPERKPYLFDFVDKLRGNAYIQFFGGKINQTTILDENYITGKDGQLTSANDDLTWGAQTFTPRNISGSGDLWLKSVEVYIFSDYTVTDLTVEIQEIDGENKPDGTALASSVRTINNADYTFETFEFNKHIKLLDGHIYALVVKLKDPSSYDMYWGYDGSSPTYTGGNYLSTTDGGTNWIIDTTKDFLFKINGWNSSPYTLFPNRFDSDPESEAAINNINFDIIINQTSIIDGEALLNINTNGQTDIKTELFRVRNNVGLSIGTNTTLLDSTRKTMIINLDKTTFKKGDKLRLEISSATGTFTINYTDNDSATEKNIILYIPFKLDI